MKKIVACFVAFAVALLCAATILSPAVAGAEVCVISNLEAPFAESSFFYEERRWN